MKDAPDINDTLRNEGEDAARQRHDNARKFKPKGSGADSRALPFILFDQIELVPKEWLARDFLGAGETSCWYGHPGDGKSVLIEDFGLHVAAGMIWLSRSVKQGAVLYIALERRQLVERRALAFKLKHKVKGLPFAIIGGVLDFRDQKTAATILETVAEVEKATSQKVVLIIVDTISRALCGGDENSPKDMGALVSTIGRVQDAIPAHIALVHHVPHEADRMRGHGSLLGAIDTTVHVARGAGQRSGTVVKDNDGADGEHVDFTLESIELCSDTSGVTSAPVVIKAAKIEAAGAQQASRGSTTIRSGSWTSSTRRFAQPQPSQRGRTEPDDHPRELEISTARTRLAPRGRRQRTGQAFQHAQRTRHAESDWVHQRLRVECLMMVRGILMANFNPWEAQAPQATKCLRKDLVGVVCRQITSLRCGSASFCASIKSSTISTAQGGASF